MVIYTQKKLIIVICLVLNYVKYFYVNGKKIKFQSDNLSICLFNIYEQCLVIRNMYLFISVNNYFYRLKVKIFNNKKIF